MFRTILLPVDFEINTEMAVKKTLELSNPGQTVIHLFHVQKPAAPWSSVWKDIFHTDGNDKIQYKLLEWKRLIEENYPDVQVMTEVAYSMKIERAIIDKAREIKADLIVIGKHSHHKWLTIMNTVFPNNIAKKTGYPVLTFKPGSVYNELRSIVVPVGPEVPQRKVDLILALKQKFRITIHLMTVISRKQNANNFSAYSLLETYRYLRDVAQCPLDHEVLHGENVAQTAFEYAKSIKADMLLVEPESETKISSFPTKHIIDELKPNSKLQILAVQP
ncbi:MAG TPA: universal stress protein [Chitinophagaceae bacterium]|nr:universal stress protein [Chitinophagaceae bacterium]